MEEASDARVIERSLDDPPVFALVFDRHFDSVRRYLARRVGVDTADDLAAQTFTTAFDARRRYDLTHAEARPWLFGIATNLVRHHRRSEGRRLRAYARLDAPGPGDGGLVGIEARLDAQALAPLLADALLHLSSGDRDVLLLAAWADLTYEQIGVALHIPTGTVRSRLHRARRQLRERIGVSGQYPADDACMEAPPSNG